jgi:hypothetical protein
MMLGLMLQFFTIIMNVVMLDVIFFTMLSVLILCVIMHFYYSAECCYAVCHYAFKLLC